MLVLGRLYRTLVMRKASVAILSYEAARPEAMRLLGDNWKGHLATVPLPMLRSMSEPGEKGLSSDILFFGRLEAYKGIDFLERILEVLEQRNRRPTMLIIGKGPKNADVARLVKRFANVHHEARYVTNTELATTVQNAGVVVLPYRKATGSHSVHIANHHGVPVVATREGCFPEYVEEGINGSLIDFGDAEGFANAILKWLDNPDKSRQSEAIRHYSHHKHRPELFADGIRKACNIGINKKK